MRQVTSTDKNQSSASAEFVWDIQGQTEVHDFVAEPVTNILRSNQVKSVLDLGCGNGAFTGLLAQHGFDVTGYDGSASGIEIARRNHPGIRFLQHDLTKPLNADVCGKYDAVVSVEVIEHLLLPRKLVETAIAALRPGGIFVLTTPYHGFWKNLAIALTNQFDSHWHPLRDYGHIKFFSKPTILALFREFDFEALNFRTVGRIPAFARSMIISGRKPK